MANYSGRQYKVHLNLKEVEADLKKVKNNLLEYSKEKDDLESKIKAIRYEDNPLLYRDYHQKINWLKEMIRRCSEDVNGLLKTLGPMWVREAKEKERKHLKAKVAALEKQPRKPAASVKKEISDQKNIYSNCPYCHRELGDSPHADHIYPVDLGGLSIKNNMVYICKECNQKKSNRTLREFVKNNKLNAPAIEEILERLGKKF